MLQSCLSLWLMLILCAPAYAGELPGQEELGASEEEISRQVRGGRLSQDEIIKAGEKLSYFTRLKLYYYSRELEPYFLGLEDAFRDLARTPASHGPAIAQARDAVGRAMARARQKLLASGRDDAEADWRRGLLGLIWLDQQWRGRIKEKGKDEIQNPYDLIALVDCLDADLRGLTPAPPGGCPAPVKNEENP